jgi:carbonic anhydrase
MGDMMNKKTVIAVIFLAVSLIALPVYVKNVSTAGDSLRNLFSGNEKFVKKSDSDLMKELTKGQKPYAVVVTCSDSRVAPEIIFNETLGKIFVIRTAGNVVDKITIGSIEYAVEHLKVPLVVVMGHQSCGAVKAAMESKGHAEGNIGAILKEIAPSVKKAKSAAKAGDNIENMIITENVKAVIKSIKAKSKIIAEEQKHGKVEIVGMYYSLETGKAVKVD